MSRTKRLFLTGLMVCLPAASFAAAPAIPFTVTMNEPVTIGTCTGSSCPYLSLNVDGNTRSAYCPQVTNSATLTCTYTATAGDLDLDGIGFVDNNLHNNGISVTDQNSNALTNLAFTPPANISAVKVDYPSLSLDFTNGSSGRYTYNGTAYTTLASFLSANSGSFTRSSPATYYDSTGTLQTATSGTPRFDYDPVTHTFKGLLLEETRTNYTKDSANIISANWSTESGSTVLTSNTTTAPDGTTTADKIVDNASNVRHIIIPTQISLTSGTSYTATFFAKAAEQQYVQALFGSGGFGTTAYANFQLSGSGSVTYTAASITSATITNAGNGWYRCRITAPATSTTTDYHLFIALLNNTNNTTRGPSYIGTGGGIYVWGFQTEAGAYPTSYIPTTSASVTRSTDIFTIPTSAWYNQSAGSVSENISWETSSGTGYPMLWRFDDTTNSNRWNMWIYQGSPVRLGFDAFTGSTGQGSASVVSTLTGSAKISAAQFLNNTRSAVNGSLNTLQSTYTPPTVTQLTLHTYTANKWIKTFKYYPLRVSDSQVQLLSQ